MLTKESYTPDKKDLEALDLIISDLIARNMQRGSSYDQAKEQTFNRLAKEYPMILQAWISARAKKEEN